MESVLSAEPHVPSSVAIQRRGAVQKLCSSKPGDSPFKLKAAAVSPLVTEVWTTPVFGGLVTGADAPKNASEVMSLAPLFRTQEAGARVARSCFPRPFFCRSEPLFIPARGCQVKGRWPPAPNQCAGLLAWPNAECGRFWRARGFALRLIGAWLLSASS